MPGASRPIRASLSPQASPRMDGEPPAGPQARGPAARGAEPGDGSGAAGAPTGAAGVPAGAPTGAAGAPTGGLPTSGTSSDAPGARPVATGSAFEGAPPPYSPPDPKSFHLLYPPFPAGYPQQGPIFYPSGPGPQPFPAPGFPHGHLPYSAYHPQPGAGPSLARHGHQRPKDYTVESVLVTIFCCLITGVMALVYSHETRAALARGDMAQAYLASKKAQSLVLISLLFGLFASISWIVYVLVSLYL
ncbi:proline rich transmembrane protein 1B [Serinus canaria]|uniref:proline rich transmembrane protein 1B n=1 Tax=Serinus canaria TaxID=9135 RepID=UPI0021CC4E79|nr:proline rich transmembrane protein 1B [Serinus canaria]